MGLKGNYIPNIVCAQYTDKQIQNYATEFFSKLMTEYNILIETSFSAIMNSIPFYSAQPIVLIVEIYTKNKLNDWSLIYGYKKKLSGLNEVEVTVNPGNSKFNLKKDFINVHWLGLEDIFYEDNAKQIAKGLNTNKVDRICVLREWVYKLILKDIDHILMLLLPNKDPACGHLFGQKISQSICTIQQIIIKYHEIMGLLDI